MTAFTLSEQDGSSHQSRATQAASPVADAFKSFDARLNGARFAELIGLYWCEVAFDRDDVENPKYPSRRRINRKQGWERLHNYEYIRFNTPKFADMIVLDVDDKDPGALTPGNVEARMKQVREVASAEAVKPTMVGLNPAPGKRSFQMIWHMEKPAYETGWERDLFNALQVSVTSRFGGDPNFNGSLSRNPLSLTNQSDGYWWWYSDWEPRTWYEMNLHYARDSFEDFEQVHEDILEQEVRIATAHELFEPDRDGRPAKKREVVMTFDTDGKVNRRNYIFKKSKSLAYNLMFTGQPVTPETVYPLVLSASEEAYALDPRLERPDERYLRRTAKYIAKWINDEMIPGGGRELRYKSTSKYTRSQASMGGQRAAETNMASGRFVEETAPKGRAKISSNKARRYAAIQQAYRMLTPEVRSTKGVALLVKEFGLTAATIRAALDAADLRETKQGAGAHGRRSAQTRVKHSAVETSAHEANEPEVPERPSRRRRPRPEHEAEVHTSICIDDLFSTVQSEATDSNPYLASETI